MKEFKLALSPFLAFFGVCMYIVFGCQENGSEHISVCMLCLAAKKTEVNIEVCVCCVWSARK